MPRTWSSVLARTGVPTGDGRILAPAGGSGRTLPLPLSWQPESGDGHDGSMVVGRIESMRFDNGMVTATGSLLDSAPYQVIESLEAGVIGPSVDLDDIEYVMDEQERIVLTQWRVAGATLVAIPAFADVSLTLDPEPVEAMEGSTEASEPDWIYASATPVLPPADWFAPYEGDQPLTVTPEGRVFGLIAPWGQCHIGLPGCVTAPSSQTEYTYFHTGWQDVAEGGGMAVGTLTAGPRHADPKLAYQAAMQHYDDVNAAVARVVAGENEHGIWVSGWIIPDAKPEAVRVFLSSPVSGDWRRIGGSLELVAVCSVNTPGFPVPRARVAFSNGHQRTLVGAFGITPHVHDIGNPDTDGAPMDDYDNCRDPECPGTEKVPSDIPPAPSMGNVSSNDDARARWAWATVEV